MPDFPAICLLRHGETAWNAEGRLQGRLDSPLTALGRQQALAQGDILRRLGVGAGWQVWSSPQVRALDTARLACEPLGLPVGTDARLCEIDMGGWQGLLLTDIAARWPGAVDADDPFAVYLQSPGGERPADLHRRAASFLRDLTGPAVIVTHGILGRVMRTILMDHPLDSFRGHPGGQGVVHLFRDGQQTTHGG